MKSETPTLTMEEIEDLERLREEMQVKAKFLDCHIERLMDYSSWENRLVCIAPTLLSMARRCLEVEEENESLRYELEAVRSELDEVASSYHRACQRLGDACSKCQGKYNLCVKSISSFSPEATCQFCGSKEELSPLADGMAFHARRLGNDLESLRNAVRYFFDYYSEAIELEQMTETGGPNDRHHASVLLAVINTKDGEG